MSAKLAAGALHKKGVWTLPLQPNLTHFRRVGVQTPFLCKADRKSYTSQNYS
jgi:hypothetical protein